MFKAIWYIVFSPYYLIKWWLKRKAAKRRRRNYEILGNYVALLGNNPEILQYFRHLIEKGIPSEELHTLLETNLKNLKNFEIGKKRDLIKSQLEQETNWKQMAAEQQELLVQSRISLEQIKFREEVLDNLYHKIKKKYNRL